MVEVKIMTYNVLHGFHQVQAPFALERQRLEAAQRVVADENPDILAITEAAYGGPNQYGVSMNYAQLFGYPYVYFAPRPPYEWGNCLLSRFPIEGSTIVSGDRTALRAEIDLGKSKLNLDIFHPDCNSTDDEKIDATSSLLKELPDNYILTGDFNALSDEDEYDRIKLINGFRRFDPNPIKSVDRLLAKKLIPHLKEKGLGDAFSPQTRRFTMPTSIYGPYTDSRMRIDYFFVTPKIKALETRVIQNELTEMASDHYPIVGVFEIN